MELVAVREDLDRNERRLESTDEAEPSFLEQIRQDRDRDKEKIKMLEGEIERLRQEVGAIFSSTLPV
jgi:predicted  nucleic acid-binding Zn-ribbon protein